MVSPEFPEFPTRYSQTYLIDTGEGLEYVPEFSGTKAQAVEVQNMKIDNYHL
jgi:hypothetical protein